MRWIVGSSLRFRFVVLVAGAAMMFFGGQQAPRPCRLTPSPSSPSRASRSRRPASGSRRPRWRAWSPSRWSRRCTACRAWTRAFEVGPPALVDRASLQARNRHLPRAPARGRASGDRRSDPAHVGGTTLHHADDVDDEPRDEDRRLVEDALPHAALDDRLLEDQGASPARARRRERRHLGRAPAAAARAGRSGADAGPRRDAGAGHGDDGRLARRGSPQILVRSRHRHRRVRRHLESASLDPAHPAHRRPCRPGAVPVEGADGQSVRLGHVADVAEGHSRSQATR